MKLTPEQSQWVENTLRHMSVEEKVGQVLFATYHGSFTSTDSPAYAQMLHSINDLHVGGFITINHAWLAARHREEPGLSHGGAHKSTAIQIEVAASVRSGFRARRCHASR